jgi:hypothetical protein
VNTTNGRAITLWILAGGVAIKVIGILEGSVLCLAGGLIRNETEDRHPELKA